MIECRGKKHLFRYRKWSIKLIFEVALQRTFYGKISRNGNIWIFYLRSQLHVYLTEVILVLEQWQLIKCLLCWTINGKSWIASKCNQVTITCNHSTCLELLWLLRIINIFISNQWNTLIWCQDKTCVVSLCLLSFKLTIFMSPYSSFLLYPRTS